MFRSAFISILGMPNAGKSTLLNALLGEALVITNKKAQTTRHRIKGILNLEGHQLIFSDTPGVIEDSAYLLQEHMMAAVHRALEDADILLVVVDAAVPDSVDRLVPFMPGDERPVVVAINKMDLSGQDKVNELITRCRELFRTEFVFPISALNDFNLISVVDVLKELAPEHPPFYDSDIISDENLRFLVSEMIRAQMLSQFDKEVPYSAEVVVEDYKESPKIDRISATIYLERDSQRVIVLGKGGASIKRLGTNARKDIERFIGKKVFLALSVKIRKNWRKDELQLKRFGYIKE